MLTASASASRSQSPRTATDDRNPDLPPPFPFASTSASAVEVDARRASAKPESGASTPAGSGSGRGTPKDEDVEDGKRAGRAQAGKGAAAGGARSDKGKGKSSGKGGKVVDVPEPQLIGHLPVATAEAGRTFVELDESTYANKTIGDVKYYEPDMARCDCSPDSSASLFLLSRQSLDRESAALTLDPLTLRAGVADDEQSCGELSNCMNRLMQIECLKGDCKCGSQCQNQRCVAFAPLERYLLLSTGQVAHELDFLARRFQNREYAPIEVVKTEKKGFGVRAEADIPACVLPLSPPLSLGLSPKLRPGSALTLRPPFALEETRSCTSTSAR